MRTPSPPLAPLFRSDGQARLLAAVFFAEQEVSIRDLAERAAVPYGTAYREALRLLEAGILSERRAGQARLVRPDEQSPLHDPLQTLLLVSFGPGPLLARALAGQSGIEAVALFGSYAARLLGQRGPLPQDVDVLIIGEPDVPTVYDACEAVARQVARPVNTTVLSAAEWQQGSAFVADVAAGPLVEVLGTVPGRA